MTLREQRVYFTEALVGLVSWISRDTEFDVALDEVTVHSPRAARRGVELLVVEDAVHKRNSFHHKGLAADLILYDQEGVYLRDGEHPVWKRIAEKWKSFGSECTSGIGYGDPNHVSWGEK